MNSDVHWMRRALRLALRGYGQTSPNPMVGAVLVRRGKVIGEGWHRKAGEPHAEVEAIRDAQDKGQRVAGATLYVTLEPCCTHGRTPPCTQAIINAGISRVIVAAIDPNPRHSGRGFKVLRASGVRVVSGVLESDATKLNEAFNHWIVNGTPFVTVKAAMTLDGKIAAVGGESKWITGEAGRAYGMRLRQRADAILVGVNTILADDPSLTFRSPQKGQENGKVLRRVILDTHARTPLTAKVLTDASAHNTIVVVGKDTPQRRVAALAKKGTVWRVPTKGNRIDVRWLLRRLGNENVTDLLVEGGGEVNASFLLGRFAHRIAFFYAPKILGGRASIKAVGGDGLLAKDEWLRLKEVEWQNVGRDLLLTARVD